VQHDYLFGKPPWCCPRQAEFYRSAVQAGARLIGIGAVAGNRTRTSCMARRYSAVKSQPRKLKGPGAFSLPAHAISTKNKHLLAIYSIPTRGFTAAVSVFRGTPPAKPLLCKFKIRLARLGNTNFRSWAHPTGEASLLVLAKFNLSPEDIIKMSLCSYPQILYLSSLLVSIHALQGKQKTLLAFRQAGWKKFCFVRYLLAMSLSNLTCCSDAVLDRLRLNTLPGLYRL